MFKVSNEVSMTEDDVTKMIAEVESTAKVDVNVEKEWILRELAIHIKNEQEIVLTFRTHKHLRNDVEMKNTYNNLMKTREITKYLQERLNKLLANL